MIKQPSSTFLHWLGGTLSKNSANEIGFGSSLEASLDLFVWLMNLSLFTRRYFAPSGARCQVRRDARLAAELDDDAVQRAVRFLALEDLDHVLFGERLEVEAVGGVVVGRDGFGVAVDHDGLVAGVAEGEGGVAAAIVELDALADAVGAAAEDRRPSCGRTGRASSATAPAKGTS